MKKTRTLLAAAAAIAGLVALPGAAQAAPPRAQTFTLPTLLGSDAAGGAGVCPFPVDIVVTTNQLTFHADRPMNALTGFGSATVTNADTGEMLTFNISGPGTVTNNNNPPFTIDAHGPNLLWTTVANLERFPDVPQLAYTTGHVQVTVDASGQTTSYKLTGHSTDVCELLAP
jgi:hypothetical protein